LINSKKIGDLFTFFEDQKVLRRCTDMLKPSTSSGGTARETGFFARWADGSGALYDFILLQDIVSDAIMGAGKYAFVQYTIQV